MDATSAQLPNSLQIATSGHIQLGPQSKPHATSPNNKTNSMSKHSSHIVQKVKPQPLSAIGLIHPNGEYSAFSGLNQAQHSGGPSQKPMGNAIFAMEGLSPLDIKMGSLAGSFGTWTPEGASLASSAQVAQPKVGGGQMTAMNMGVGAGAATGPGQHDQQLQKIGKKLSRAAVEGTTTR